MGYNTDPIPGKLMPPTTKGKSFGSASMKELAPARRQNQNGHMQSDPERTTEI